MAQPQQLAVVGATGTGKSDLAIELALAFSGEVVSVDAYQVFRGMDIGTAKVSPEQRRLVPHHMLDLADPDEEMNLAIFLRRARTAIQEVHQRGRLPILAGGSGQHMWALLEGWQVPEVPPNRKLREGLEQVAQRDGNQALMARLEALAPEKVKTIDSANSRRLVRAIELASGDASSSEPRRSEVAAGTLIIGLEDERKALYARLDRRFETMLAADLVDEVQTLRDSGFSDAAPVRSAAGYRELGAYLDGSLALNEAIQRAKNAHHRLARKQAGWFRKEDNRIRWLNVWTAGSQTARQLAGDWLESGTASAGPAF